jgi:hypothetical protein
VEDSAGCSFGCHFFFHKNILTGILICLTRLRVFCFAAGYPDGYPERGFGMGIRKKYSEWASGMGIRNGYPGKVSGMGIRDENPE